MVFNLLLLIFIFSAHADVNTLQAQKEALQLEYNLVQNSPGTYYLIINFLTQEVYLKADANLLRTCKILNWSGKIPTRAQKLTLQNHILPGTPEPKTILRKRALPLDFFERLTKGPKNRSRLYFLPSFMIQSSNELSSAQMPSIFLSLPDTKAIASALSHNATAIVIPTHAQNTGPQQ